MPKFSANLGFMFREHPFLERIDAAAKAGFRAVEFPYPYAFGHDLIAERLRAHGLEQTVINTPKGGEGKDDRGMACDPNRRGEFQDGIGLAIAYARALGCPRVHVLAGNVAPGRSRTKARAVYQESLGFAARAMAAHGVTALIEGVNDKVDAPGYLLNTVAEAIEIVRELGEDNLKIEFDFYHAQIMEGDLTALFKRALPFTGHIQIADTPGRHEPGTGEINYGYVLGMIDQSGWTGWVGCEYVPKTTTAEGLSWINPYLR